VKLPTKPDNTIPPQSDFARSWAVFHLLSKPANRTPELLAEAKTFPQIIFIK